MATKKQEPRYVIRLRKVMVPPPLEKDKPDVEVEQQTIDIGQETELTDDTYSAPITIGLFDNVFNEQLSKTITVVSHNADSGYAVKKQRELAVTEYVKQLNK